LSSNIGTLFDKHTCPVEDTIGTSFVYADARQYYRPSVM
jgi:hypothetical protein